MKPNRSGKYRQRVQLQVPVTPETFDSFGQPVPAYQAVGSTAPDGLFACEILPLAGRESVIAKQVYATATHKVRMRWLGPAVDLSPPNRLVRTDAAGTRTLGIISVADLEERHRMYELICEEIQTIEAV